jgi:transposase
MSEKRRRSKRQTIDLEQLKSDPDSFLSWGIDDPTLRKLEMYRLYRAGYAAADIAEAFGFARGYLYELWDKLKAEGVEALIDKRWGAASRKRTTEGEAAVLRTKALHPERGDTELAEEFGMDRSTIYRLLEEHGLQDLHRVLDGAASRTAENPSPEAEADDGEKGGSKLSPVNRHCS